MGSGHPHDVWLALHNLTGCGCPLQDFLREADVRFMNHLRRGTSIVEGDLQQDPPPATLQVCQPAAQQ